jgi:hypothetical protein
MFANKVVSIANGVIMLQIPQGVGERGFDQVFVAWSLRCSIAFTVLSKIYKTSTHD